MRDEGDCEYGPLAIFADIGIFIVSKTWLVTPIPEKLSF
jgi:hypothetical protein